MHVDIRLLGGFEVVVDGEKVPDEVWRRRYAAALVKLLALQPHRRLLRDQVLDALWPDLLVEEAAPRLHKAAHYARTALGVRDGVVLAGETVSLLPGADVAVDLVAFERAAGEALADGGAPAAGHAAELYGGLLLPEDLYEPWTQQVRDTSRLRHLDLLRRAGQWDRVAAADPVDEEAHLRVMRDRLREGDRRGVLRQFELLERALEEELGLEPGDAAVALRDEALALAVTEPPEPPGTSQPAGSPARTPAATGREGPAAGTPQIRRSTPVPLPPTATVGRGRDLEAIGRMLEEHRVVTLLGPGGVGKTRLAIEAARRHGDAHDVESCFVDLTQVDRADLVPELVLRHLGVHSSGAQDDVRLLLREALRGRSLLLVLDNYEHVVDAADLVSDVVGWSEEVHLLCTSRARLNVPGEHVYDVEPLPVEGAEELGGVGTPSIGDAVTLFEQVASAVDPRFELADCLPDVVAICRTLDGLPLAIELAAGHVRTLPPTLLRTRLGARLGSPSGAARTMPPRQITIPATIDWSLQLLGARERQLFARLGVFSGPVSLETVERVCGGPDDDVLDALSRLVDQSLVRRVAGPRGQPRFVLLELLRERARELLAGEDRARTEERHAQHVAAFLDEIDESRWTTTADRWIDLVLDEMAEIRSAHAWAVRHGDGETAARITAGLGTFWHREGHFVEGRAWVAAALDHEEQLDRYLAARLRLAAGFVEWQRDQHVSRRHWQAAEALFRELGHPRYLAYALALTSVTYVGEAENYEAATRLCDEAIALSRTVGEAPLLAQALNIKGELTRIHGDDEAARVAYEEGRDLAASVHDESHLSVLVANLSYLADHRGDHAEARRLGCDALRLCWAAGRQMMAAWTISELAGPDLGLGHPERGALLVGAADHVLDLLGATRQASDLPEHSRIITGLRERLGDGAFERLYAEGARLSLREAVALALAEEPDVARTGGAAALGRPAG